MKKFLTLSLFLLFAGAASAQLKIGLRLAPQISTTRVDVSTTGITAENGGSALKFTFGPIADYFFNDNYAFSTGLWFTTKKTDYSLNNESFATPFSNEIDLQYIQVPLALKLFTNEVATDIRLFFQMGGTLDFKINEDNSNSAFVDTDFTRPFNAGVLVGFGVEYFLGESTLVFAGIDYNRGLINTQKSEVEIAPGAVVKADDLTVNHDLIALAFGLKF